MRKKIDWSGSEAREHQRFGLSAESFIRRSRDSVNLASLVSSLSFAVEVVLHNCRTQLDEIRNPTAPCAGYERSHPSEELRSAWRKVSGWL